MPRLHEFYKEPAAEQGEDPPCSLCEAHRQASEAIPDEHALLCVQCGQPIDMYALSSQVMDCPIFVVGESNAGNQTEQFRKAIRVNCPHCDEIMAVDLVHVIWNANHDVYYTGGRHYCPDILEIYRRTEELLKPQIENFVERLAKGEPLKAWNLLTWIKYGVEHLVAGILYEAGMQGRSPAHEGPNFALLPHTMADESLIVQGPEVPEGGQTFDLAVDYCGVDRAAVLEATHAAVAALNQSWMPAVAECKRRQRGEEEESSDGR